MATLEEVRSAVVHGSPRWQKLVEQFCASGAKREMKGLGLGFIFVTLAEKPEFCSPAQLGKVSAMFFAQYGQTPPVGYEFSFTRLAVQILALQNRQQEARRYLARLNELVDANDDRRADLNAITELCRQFSWLR